MLLVIVLIVLTWGVRRLEPRLAFFPFAGEDVTPGRFGLAYTPLTIETADGERLHAWHIPRPDAVGQVLYLHGNGGNLSMWADILAPLWSQKLEIVAVDYRGYGLSSGSPTEQGLYRDVDAAIGYVHEKLRRHDAPLIYWGRSIGAAMAAYAASRREPDGIVLEAGFSNARAVLQTNPVMWLLSFFATYRFPTSEWMTGVKAPALVIHGDRDSVVPYRLGQRLYDELRGPKRFLTIRGGDHNDPTPADPDLYWTAVREFVQSLR